MPSVGRLLRARAEKADNAEQFDDGWKLGLSVEGGGLRGVVSGAMLIAIDDLGLKGVFDGYYGTSAGSINLAYFATGGRWNTLSVYYDHLARHGFVDLSRPLRERRPALNMSVLFDQIMENEVRLDYSAVATARIPLGIGVSDLEAHEGHVITCFSSGKEVREYLRAGAWVPVLAGPPVEVNGRRLLDGAMYFRSPLDVAVLDGCTHAVLLSTDSGEPKGRPRVLAERYLARRLDRWSPGAGFAYLRASSAPPPPAGESTYRGIQALGIQVPCGGHSVGNFTTNRSSLLDGARAGYVAVMRALGTASFESPPFCLDLS